LRLGVWGRLGWGRNGLGSMGKGCFWGPFTHVFHFSILPFFAGTVKVGPVSHLGWCVFGPPLVFFDPGAWGGGCQVFSLEGRLCLPKGFFFPFYTPTLGQPKGVGGPEQGPKQPQTKKGGKTSSGVTLFPNIFFRGGTGKGFFCFTGVGGVWVSQEFVVLLLFPPPLPRFCPHHDPSKHLGHTKQSRGVPTSGCLFFFFWYFAFGKQMNKPLITSPPPFLGWPSPQTLFKTQTQGGSRVFLFFTFLPHTFWVFPFSNFPFLFFFFWCSFA